ncbi:response regulator [Roseobacter ponti]|uniref:Response regulator n=1 Tax=Roseobacter ponti TaxID=1891787 RepID=A0A858SX23_9RHOB|nr:response regulator [Roseobacter ponti]QJF52558.1 response regulator [Roseobacter ponti]
MAVILIVEDNDMNLDMLSRRLKRKGYDILDARDGQAGVDRAFEDKPDLILMDMSLPVLDGWQATRMIKSNPETAGIPVVALTAHAMASDREKAMDAGCDAFYTKPIELPGLLDIILDLLSR